MPRAAYMRLGALVGVLLVLGVLLCVFDGDDGLSTDLCLMSLALLGSALALLPLPVVGRLEFRWLPTYALLLADLPSPPPRA
jgi:hypothetical protein